MASTSLLGIIRGCHLSPAVRSTQAVYYPMQTCNVRTTCFTFYRIFGSSSKYLNSVKTIQLNKNILKTRKCPLYYYLCSYIKSSDSPNFLEMYVRSLVSTLRAYLSLLCNDINIYTHQDTGKLLMKYRRKICIFIQ